MKGQIGFSTEHPTTERKERAAVSKQGDNSCKPSLVQVFFEEKGMTLTYYNDRFDLRRGDPVFVSGKLEGHRGRVTTVCYGFKIRPSDYERVISVADTEVHGDFFAAGSMFAVMDEAALPPTQAKSWFLPIGTEGDEYITASDGSSFPLENLKEMGVSDAVAERGHGYYMENRVRYLHLGNGKGYAIVEGKKPYEVEFRYADGRISDLVCSCYCSGCCKHTFAAMLQLKELLGNLESEREQAVHNGAPISAMHKGTFLTFALLGYDTICFSL